MKPIPLHHSADLCTVFGALSDRTRYDMVRQLLHEPLSITELTEVAQLSKLFITRQAVTKHLHVLRDAGLITSERKGSQCVWRPNHRALREAQDQFHKHFPPKRRAKVA